MATHQRLQGGRTRKYTETITNQIGPDGILTGGAGRAGLPTFTDANSFFFSEDGTDSTATAGGSTNPFATPQYALDVWAASTRDYVAALDSANYPGPVDLNGGALYAVDGEAPTIVKGNDSAVSLSALGIQACGGLTWNINGVEYLIIGTTNGIRRSSDNGATFSVWVESGNHIGHMCLWDDGLEEVLVYANMTTQNVRKVTSGGTISNIGTTSTQFLNLNSVDNIGGILVAGGRNNTGYSSCYYYDGTAWVTLGPTSATTHQIYRVQKAGSGFNDNIGFCDGVIYIDDDSNPSVFMLEAIGGAIKISRIFSKSASQVRITSGNSAVFVMSDKQLYRSVYPAGGQATFSIIYSQFPANTEFLYMDSLNNLWAIPISLSTIFKSTDNGNSFQSISSVTFSGNIKAAFEHRGRIVFVNINTPYAATVEKSLVLSSTSAGLINGFILDGNNDTLQIFSGGSNNISGRYLHCKNSKYFLLDLGKRNADIQNSYLSDLYYGAIKDYNSTSSGSFVFKNNVGERITGPFFQHGNGTLDAKNNVSHLCGYHFKSGGNLTLTQLVDGIARRSLVADVYFDSDPTGSSNFHHYGMTSNGGAVEVLPSSGHFSASPLFRDESASDFRLKAKAGGYPEDSPYIGQGSTGGDVGAWAATRSTDSTSYDADLWLQINPNQETIQFTPAHLGEGIGPTGIPHYWEGGTKKKYGLSWSLQTAGESWYAQAWQIAQLFFSQDPDTVYRKGISEDGTSWKAIRSGTGTVSGSTIAVTYDGQVWGKDRWAGYWILIDGDYYRITTSTAKATSGTCTITVDGTPTTGSQAWRIDFILTKLNKKAGLTLKPIQWKEDDTIPPISDYQLILDEVDEENEIYGGQST